VTEVFPLCHPHSITVAERNTAERHHQNVTMVPYETQAAWTSLELWTATQESTRGVTAEKATL
jgi:hypothetical protein